MTPFNKTWLGFCTLILVVGTVSAHPKATQTDAQAIEQGLKHQFDKPEAPLLVRPVSVEGDYAVAGWMQGVRGGRALLHRDKGHWTIALCGGDAMAQADTLVQAGLAPSAAQRLAQSIQSAESKLTSEHRKQLSTFEGMVKVGAGHDAHHGNAPANPHHHP